MKLSEVIGRLWEVIQPFRYSEQRTKRNYIVFFGAYALLISLCLFILVNVNS